MFSSAHSGHEFEKLSAIYGKHVLLIQDDIATIESRLENLKQLKGSIDANVSAVNAAKDDACYTLQSICQVMEKSIMQQLKDKLLILDSQKNDAIKEVELISVRPPSWQLTVLYYR